MMSFLHDLTYQNPGSCGRIVYIYIYMHVYIHIHVQRYVCIHTYIYICMYGHWRFISLTFVLRQPFFTGMKLDIQKCRNLQKMWVVKSVGNYYANCPLRWQVHEAERADAAQRASQVERRPMQSNPRTPSIRKLPTWALRYSYSTCFGLFGASG